MALPLYLMILCMIQATLMSEPPNLYNKFSNHFLADNVNNNYNINKRIFAVEPKSTLIYDNNKTRRILHGKYFVKNIGRSQITITDGSCLIRRYKKNLMPGEETKIIGSETHQLRNYLKIHNPHDIRAIVYITGGSDMIEDPPENFNKIEDLKKAFTLGVRIIHEKYICNLDWVLSDFWDNKKGSVWKQIHGNLKTLLHKDIEKKISSIVDIDLEQIKDRIEALKKIKWEDRTSPYMKIATDLENFENKFVIKSESQDYSMDNFYILPYYTNVITMKILFYIWGISTINFSKDQRYQIEEFSDHTMSGAVKYVEEMYENAIDTIYKTVYPGGLYNVMMNARNHIALHGLEMFPVWGKLRPAHENFPGRVFIHSNFYGTATPDLFQLATPRLKSYTYYSSMRFIEFHMCTHEANQLRIICGLRLKFYEYSSGLMGSKSNEIQTLKIDERITNLTVYGGNIVKCLKFGFLDRTIQTFGDECSIKPTVFELEDHSIALLYVTNDNPVTGLNLDNIAVSFIRNYDEFWYL